MPILTLVAGGALLNAGVAHGASGASGVQETRAPKPISREAADTRTEQRTVASYWTEARMEAATPIDVLAKRTNGVQFSASVGAPAKGRVSGGSPLTVTPTAPGSAARLAPAQAQQAAAPNSSGTAWTRGGAVTMTTGRIFFTYQGRNASCSGSAVTSANKSVVLTAGHCVKLGGAFHSNWVFVPGYNEGERPHGTWVATRLITTPGWNSREDVNGDMAAAVVAPLDGKLLTDVVGGQGVAFNQGRRQQMYSFGYPASGRYDGSRLIYCSGRAFDDFLLSQGIGLTCNMTGGSSGGPWLLNFNESTGLGTLNSVNSFKYNFSPNWMFGPYFGTEAKAVYEAAQRGDAT
ncbi:V8-like Glu-specific endopeptidase [Thermocatellispora tengchongensis]|uniref:V8-like Glu-specific endopeptidase n=2 Tax=Thermocatellispora tengchongensis TaxID=1073253 RepID=A0A840P460_9ACTN|nr:peptidase [Thermocatellispora tengchongensis]MBB5133296.1 V8-like Glu-specific endopeptidase [Thermocatellispora tengchongensis]